MNSPLRTLAKYFSSAARSIREKIVDALGLTPFEGDKTDLSLLEEPSTEIEPISEFPVEIGLPIIRIASEEVPSGEVLSTEDFSISSRLTNEERGRLLRLEERVKDLIKRFQDYKRFEDSVKVDIKELHDSIGNIERMLMDLNELREGYSAVENNLHELAALYDLISTQFNPFIDSAPLSSGDLTEREVSKDTEREVISEIPLLQWLAFLESKIGKEQIPKLLEHYERSETISKALKEKALSFLESTLASTREPEVKNNWRLSVDDQIKSLEYIKRIVKRGKGGED